MKMRNDRKMKTFMITESTIRDINSACEAAAI
jgi:hypothetical protein